VKTLIKLGLLLAIAGSVSTAAWAYSCGCGNYVKMWCLTSCASQSYGICGGIQSQKQDMWMDATCRADNPPKQCALKDESYFDVKTHYYCAWDSSASACVMTTMVPTYPRTTPVTIKVLDNADICGYCSHPNPSDNCTQN